MAAPSNLPSARAVAERCFDKYRLESDPNCDIALRSDLEALAEHFAGMNTPRSVFIEHLVPWHAFVRPSNAGHAAIADFLITRAAIAGISSNYDALIERRAWDYGSDFQGSLDGDEATVDAIHRGPLAEIPRMLSSRSPFNDLGAFSADRRMIVEWRAMPGPKTHKHRLTKAKPQILQDIAATRPLAAIAARLNGACWAASRRACRVRWCEFGPRALRCSGRSLPSHGRDARETCNLWIGGYVVFVQRKLTRRGPILRT